MQRDPPFWFRLGQRARGVFPSLTAALLVCGCERNAEESPRPAPPVEVGFVVLEPRAVLLDTELPGRVSATETSAVRPQVSGIVRARLFEEGQVVREGQALYRIDSRLYRAAEAQARANLASARAAAVAARARAERYEPLLEVRAVSEQDYADARASAEQATAAVEQATAALRTAAINLQYTEISAPIPGRIGRSLVTTGALVTANQPGPLATIQRLDPVFVDIQQSTAALIELRRSIAGGGAVAASAEVRLKLEDGTDYETRGTLQFAEAVVDPSTSSVILRARFANPDRLLLPGMYVRSVVAQAQRPAAILAPQPGVSRDPKGNATALIVGKDNKVEQREIRATRALADEWLVEQGLSAGDRLIVEGTGKVRAGQQVKPVPAATRPPKAPPQERPPG